MVGMCWQVKFCGCFQCVFVCVCVLGLWIVGIPILFEYLPYHFWGGYFLWLGYTPPPRIIPVTVRLWVTGSLSDDKYVFNESGDKIIHA